MKKNNTKRMQNDNEKAHKTKDDVKIEQALTNENELMRSTIDDKEFNNKMKS